MAGSSASGFDVASLLIGSISSAGNAYNQYQTEKAQGEYQSAMYRLNAQMAAFKGELAISSGERTARLALKRGYKESAMVRRAGKQTAGSQKAALAAQGIDIGSGSAADIIAETEAMSELDQIEIQKNARLDALTIKNNAWREAWGYKQQASIYGSEGEMALSTSKRKATTSLLTGGLQSLTYGMAAFGKYMENYPSSRKTSPIINKPITISGITSRSYF